MYHAISLRCCTLFYKHRLSKRSSFFHLLLHLYWFKRIQFFRRNQIFSPLMQLDFQIPDCEIQILAVQRWIIALRHWGLIRHALNHLQPILIIPWKVNHLRINFLHRVVSQVQYSRCASGWDCSISRFSPLWNQCDSWFRLFRARNKPSRLWLIFREVHQDKQQQLLLLWEAT